MSADQISDSGACNGEAAVVNGRTTAVLADSVHSNGKPVGDSASVGGSSGSGQSGGVELKQRVGLMGGCSIIVGTIIGSGIFISPKGVLEGAGSVGMSLTLWLICGLISMCGALCMAELGTFILESGGEHAYLKAAFGPALTFLFDWTFTLMLKPSSLAIVSLTCAEYLTVPFFDDDCGAPPEMIIKLLAAAVILLLIAVNCASVELATQIQVAFTVIKVLALIIIIFGGIVKLCQGYTEHLATGFEGTETNIGSIILGMYSGMWAYNGWNNLNYVTEEIQDPYKNLPRAIIIGVPMVIVLYLCVNVSYFTVMSVDDLLASPAVAITWAELVTPTFWWTMPIFVACSTFGAGNGNLFTTGRIVLSAARDHHTLQILSYIHVLNLTPVPSVIFIGILGILYVIPSNVSSLIDLFNFATWFFYGCGMAALIVMRWTRKNDPRPYKVNIIIPWIVLISAVILVIVPFVDDPKVEFIYAICFILGGLFFYYPFVFFKWEIPGMDSFTSWWQQFLVVAPADTGNMDEAGELEGPDDEPEETGKEEEPVEDEKGISSEKTDSADQSTAKQDKGEAAAKQDKGEAAAKQDKGEAAFDAGHQDITSL